MLLEKLLSLLLESLVFRLFLLIGQDDVQSSIQINVLRLDNPWMIPVEYLVTKIDGQEDRDADVGRHECSRVPMTWEEDIETIDEGKEDEEDEGNPGTVWLEC